MSLHASLPLPFPPYLWHLAVSPSIMHALIAALKLALNSPVRQPLPATRSAPDMVGSVPSGWLAGVQLGAHRLRNNLALAPMAGYSDVPFRHLAWQFGAGYLVSEMVSSKPELWETGKSRLRRVPVPGAQPTAIQIAGTDPTVMAEAARRHVDDGVEVIDINFGCPAKKVCRRAAGSALLGDIPLLGRIVAAVSRAVDVPVTVKTRTGLVPGDALGLQAATTAVAAGAQMIVMHARSRACKFVGATDYAAVAAVKAAIDVPLFVNGDIYDLPSAQRAMAISHADGLMLGRAAIGQPWLFAILRGDAEPVRETKWAVVLDHMAHLHEFYGAPTGVRVARKHIAAYFEALGCVLDRPAFMALQTESEQYQFVQRLRDQDANRHSMRSSAA